MKIHFNCWFTILSNKLFCSMNEMNCSFCEYFLLRNIIMNISCDRSMFIYNGMNLIVLSFLFRHLSSIIFSHFENEKEKNSLHLLCQCHRLLLLFLRPTVFFIFDRNQTCQRLFQRDDNLFSWVERHCSSAKKTWKNSCYHRARGEILKHMHFEHLSS